jgi:photosystem II stability/assembly factor-like uncharacterized protein
VFVYIYTVLIIFADTAMRTILSVLLLLLSGYVSGQCDSVYLRSSSSYISAIHVFDSLNMIGIGDNGDIIRTTDGGNNWKLPLNYKPSGQSLSSLSFPSPQTGYAAGYGNLLKTEDGGQSWFHLVAPSSAEISTAFMDEKRGFVAASNGRVYVTSDGGKTWPLSVYFFSKTLRSMALTKNNVAVVYGNGNFMARSVDTGKTWTQVDLGFLPFNTHVISVEFFDNNFGYAGTANGSILKTTDAGQSWTLQTSMPDDLILAFHIQSIDTALALRGYNFSTLFRTTNGGTTWEPLFPSTPLNRLYSFASDPLRKLVIVAGSGGKQAAGFNGRTIASTKDLGTTWKVHSNNFGDDFRDLQFLNDSVGIVSGAGGRTFKTTDGAVSWRELRGTTSYSTNYALSFTDEQNGFVLNDSLYRTTDGGTSWTTMTRPPVGNQLQASMKFLTANKGFISNGYVLFGTTDGGNTWQTALDFSNTFNLKSGVSFFRNKAIVVGYNGYAMQSSDSANTWSPIPLITNGFLTGAYIYNDSLAFIGTNGNLIYRTTNGGQSWTAINTGADGWQMRHFRFVNDSVGYMIGLNNGGLSVVYGTRNQGLTWYQIKWIYENVNAVSGVGTLYLAGDDALLYKMESLTVPSIPGYIVGKDSVCIASGTGYLLPEADGITYEWFLSGGGTQQPFANKDSVSWTQPGLYQLSARAKNFCGGGPVRTLPVTVVDYKPVIINTGNTLSVQGASQQQWLLNGSTYGLPGAASIQMQAPGYYSVVATNSMGCRDTSDAFVFTVTGINPLQSSAIKVFPMPAYDRIHVTTNTDDYGVVRLELMNANGTTLIGRQWMKSNTAFSANLDVSGLPAGMYFLRVTGPGRSTSIQKIVISR